MRNERQVWVTQIAADIDRIVGAGLAQHLRREIEHTVASIADINDVHVQRLGPDYYAGELLRHLGFVEHADVLHEKVASYINERGG